MSKLLFYESWGDYVKELAAQQDKDLPKLSETMSRKAPSMESGLEKLARGIRPINVVEMVTPVNAKTEKEKWLEEARNGNFTNPQYEYNTELLEKIAALSDSFPDWDSSYAHAEKILKTGAHLPSCILAMVMQERITEAKEAVGLANAMLVRMDTSSVKHITNLYGKPSRKTIDKARDYACESARGDNVTFDTAAFSDAEIKKLGEMEFDAEGIKRVFYWVAKRCGFETSRPIEVSDTATSIDVRDKSSVGPIVVIPKDRKVSGIKLVTLTAHEILCHWRDSENVCPFLAKELKSSDEIIYEGHAMAVERQTNLMLHGAAPKMPKPYYLMAMDAALNGCNFATTAKSLHQTIRSIEGNPNRALNLTYLTCMRVFRGATDTTASNTGYAFTKDRAYFEGALLVEALRMSGLGNLLEYGILGTTDLLQLGTLCRLDTENMKYKYSNELLFELAGRLLKGEFLS